MTRSSEDARLKEIQRMEEGCLEELGTLLASCTMKLLHVAEATISSILPEVKSNESIQIQCTCLLSVLNNTSIEAQVRHSFFSNFQSKQSKAPLANLYCV